MSTDKKGKSLFGWLFGDSNDTEKPSAAKPTHNYGNHVGTNHGIVTQVGGGTSGSYTSALVLGEKKTLTVNGRQFEGRTVEQKNGRIFVDGHDVTDEVKIATNQIIVVVQGDVSKLEAQGIQQLTVSGNAGAITSTHGRIEIKGDVSGSVESISGPITCGKVGGSVESKNGPISTH